MSTKQNCNQFNLINAFGPRRVEQYPILPADSEQGLAVAARDKSERSRLLMVYSRYRRIEELRCCDER